MPDLQHFILTRFNLRLWSQDKNGDPVRSREWLENRFELFEKYCLPSVANQSCKDFTWIILLDSRTVEEFKKRIEDDRDRCPQIVPVYVEPAEGQNFAKIFQSSVVERLNGERVITTYLDNDDALDVHFVEDLQKRAAVLTDSIFISYSSGFQYFTEFGLLMKIHYRRNHFISVIESGNPETVKTIYGYGSHYYIEKIPGVQIEYVNGYPSWCEVIHKRNMGNDAYFFWGTRMVQDNQTLIRDFAIDVVPQHGFALYAFKFIPRYIKVFFLRVKYFFFGRRW